MNQLVCVLVGLGAAVSAVAAASPGSTAKPLTDADCPVLLKKTWTILQEVAKVDGHTLTDADRATFLEECKKAIAKDPHDPDLTCVVAAADDAAVRACLKVGAQAAVEQAKTSEAPLMLDRLAKHAKIFFVTNAMFPKGKAARLPAQACCPQAGHKCAVTDAWAKDPVWAALDLTVDEPNRFQYTYDSADGLTFHATATGDVACTGKPVTYTVDGKVVHGAPITTRTDPK